MGPEYLLSELPLIKQLQAQGWQYIEGSLDDASVTGRDSFAEVLQTQTLREQLVKVNLRTQASGEQVEWLDEQRVNQAISAISRVAASKLMEANQKASELLTNGIIVDGLPDWDGGRARSIHFIDWDTPENNTFTVINQFKVKCPPGHDTSKKHIIPDLVLLVNGIPLVVIECKNPDSAEPMAAAINQLRRYSNQRFAGGEVEDNEGAPQLFNTNQLMIAASFEQCLVGTIGARAEFYKPWKTIATQSEPKRCEKALAKELGVSGLSAQQRLVAGMLMPESLLDIIRHFILFVHQGGQTIKMVCRYQQYRGVVRSVQRLLSGKTRKQDGEYDRRGGIVWHTQGSGKSLTMMFLIRKLRTDIALRRFKVVIVTDRKDLQKQLSSTASLTDEMVSVANNNRSLKNLLKQDGPGIVFAMIQKYRESQTKAADPFELLNASEDILVMVDEAHRTQSGDLHANLLSGIPNCARIGFTGTPIIMGEKKRTHEVFGEFIDKYTIKEAEADGATVPILYEGRTVNGAVKDGSSLDELFEDFFSDKSEEELEAIKKKYATKGNVLEATLLIEEKAADMLRHYVTNILPNGYKAQVVAYSRLAAVRYYKAFIDARDKLLFDAERLPEELKGCDNETLCRKSPKVQALIQAWRYKSVLARMEFSTIISSDNNDGPEWAEHTDRAKQDKAIERFKKPLLNKELGAEAEQTEAGTDPLSFLIVKSMLLTGFDAPIEGVMYLDRSIREAELLQTIARVNRTGYGKQFGIVVDYYGVANHLKAALAAYSDEDVEGALRSLKDEVPALRERHIRAVDIFRSKGIESLDDIESCVQLLSTERLRQEFSVKLKAFLQSLEQVLPRPEGLPFAGDAKALAMIQNRARMRYRDSMVIGKDVGAKVRTLIDEHIISLGSDPKVAPVNLTDAHFEKSIDEVREQVATYCADPEEQKKAVASDMEHAIKSHITKHLDEDPIYYVKLSDYLKQILEDLAGQWDELIKALQSIIDEVRSGSTKHEEGLPDIPEHYLPFYRMLKVAVSGEDKPDLALEAQLIELTEKLVAHIQDKITTTSFWEPHRLGLQEELEQYLFETLYESELLDFDHIEPLVDKLRELAKANSYKLEAV
ncbi:type I restriction endonuclease subunit R [Pseudoalteromonas sp. Scap03]|uniref:type I restriction endonuclease subunit R n=1 Tax=unclassified Pseudoalteromonas TaxID=194690 RepID=UPI0015BC5E41|nr:MULTISPECIES: HsdR family type I site-specific deoxyribonuclease [unclassified Pseudoalteromonas]NWL15367.1 type I restriction endonuclease subunit R [Pseudoalteromonas sp. Scap03]QLE80518.1 type I restriction endonuclease subunit R [Pseudoalteromonas sp. Scap25]QLE88461.1 type I restriction endonuclease subunit R [Pseudoalteromonas sp. Scap06]